LGIDSRSLYLGGRSGADFFDGALDDVRLYNYALTQNEISKLRGLNQPAGARVVKWVEIQ
jgi:hypothetical protein